MISCASNKWTPNIHMFKRDGLHSQNMQTILGSVANIVGDRVGDLYEHLLWSYVVLLLFNENVLFYHAKL